MRLLSWTDDAIRVECEGCKAHQTVAFSSFAELLRRLIVCSVCGECTRIERFGPRRFERPSVALVEPVPPLQDGQPSAHDHLS